MADEFMKEVLGEEAVNSARSSGGKAGKPKQRMSGRKKAIIGGISAVCVVGIALAVLFLWPKGSKAESAYLEGLDMLCEPTGVVTMSDGSFLVTDTYGKKIWKVKNGHGEVYAGAESVADLYGEPMGGYNDANLMESLFREPWAIVSFLNGYAVSDTENHAVRLITEKEVLTVNGHSEALEMEDLGVTFDLPTGLAADEAGNLYVADTGRGSIYRIDTTGKAVELYAGMNAPMGLCWQGNALYVAETGEHRIVKLQDGQLSVIAGTGEEGDEDGPALSATFASPKGVAVAPDGTVYVADTVNSCVRRVKNGMVDTIMTQSEGKLETYPVSPTGMLVKDGILYVCDPFSRRVYVMPQ